MKFYKKFAGVFLLAMILLAASAVNLHAQDFEFRVKNNTRVTIKSLLVAEPGAQSWSYFDIGRGIAPGRTALLYWDESTNDEQCVQWFKAVYADRTESAPARFDFCEDDLLLVFNP